MPGHRIASSPGAVRQLRATQGPRASAEFAPSLWVRRVPRNKKGVISSFAPLPLYPFNHKSDPETNRDPTSNWGPSWCQAPGLRSWGRVLLVIWWASCNPSRVTLARLGYLAFFLVPEMTRTLCDLDTMSIMFRLTAPTVVLLCGCAAWRCRVVGLRQLASSCEVQTVRISQACLGYTATQMPSTSNQW